MNAGPQHQYRGDLAERPLPEVLRTIDHYRVPGVVEAVREGVCKRLYVKDGNVVFATSTDIQDSLGCYMLNTGMITAEEFRSSMRERRGTDRRYGVLVLERGLATPADLYRAIRLQMAEVLWSLFSWNRGEITFSVGDFTEPSSTMIQVPLRLAIKDGVRRCENVDELIARLGGQAAVLHPDFDLDQLIEASLRGDEYQLLQCVDGDRSVEEVLRDGPLEPQTAARVLYALYVLRLVGRPGRDDSSGAIRIRMARNDRCS